MAAHWKFFVNNFSNCKYIWLLTPTIDKNKFNANAKTVFFYSCNLRIKFFFCLFKRLSDTVRWARATKAGRLDSILRRVIPNSSYRRPEKRYLGPNSLVLNVKWVDTRKRLTRGAAIDSPPVQSRGPRLKHTGGVGYRRPLVTLRKKYKRK